MILFVLAGLTGAALAVAPVWYYERKLARANGALAQRETDFRIVRVRNDSLEDLRFSEREAYREARDGWNTSLALSEKRVADLLLQVQTMAERIATLRPSMPEGGNDRFYPSAEPVKPYSLELQRWLDKIEFDEARAALIDKVEEYRARGQDDAWILDEIRHPGAHS